MAGAAVWRHPKSRSATGDILTASLNGVLHLETSWNLEQHGTQLRKKTTNRLDGKSTKITNGNRKDTWFWSLQLYSCSGGRWLRSAVIITWKRDPRAIRYVTCHEKLKPELEPTRTTRKTKRSENQNRWNQVASRGKGTKYCSRRNLTDMKHQACKHHATKCYKDSLICETCPGLSTQQFAAKCFLVFFVPRSRFAWPLGIKLSQIAYRMPPQAFRSSIIFVQFRSCETHTPMWPKAGMK